MQLSAKTHECTNYALIKKIDDDEMVVYAEVFAPYTMDTYGDIMTPEAIVKMAHSFMSQPDVHHKIDTMHNNVSNGSYPIESYIAKADDPDFTEGAWVLGVKIQDNEIWRRVKSGELNGYSLEALAKALPVVAEVIIDPMQVGITETGDDHQHYFFVELDDEGRVKSGRTSQDYGHSHSITKGTATEKAFGHSHRYFL